MTSSSRAYSRMIFTNKAMKIATQTKIAIPAISVRLMLKTAAGRFPPLAPNLIV